jgi:hypothetical protein
VNQSAPFGRAVIAIGVAFGRGNRDFGTSRCVEREANPKALSIAAERVFPHQQSTTLSQ